MSGGKVVKEQHKTATHAKERAKFGKFGSKGQLKKTKTMKLITAFENYVTSVYSLSELDRTISEDGHVVSYALTCRSNEHQFINLKQVDDDYIRFEMYFKNIRVQSDYFFTNETPETQMKIIKRLFDNTLSDYKRDIWDINEITKKD